MPDASALTRPAFVDYVPVSLAFGTSGLRGLVTDITDLESYINVKGALRYLVSIGDVRERSTVSLGGDLRPSTDRILLAAARAVTDAGFSVEYVGKVPTPCLLAHGIAHGRATVMVSGSHIPFDRNGIKLGKSRGEVLKSDEAGIVREVQRVRAEEYGKSAAASLFDAKGMLKQPGALPKVDAAAEEAYLRRYVEAFPAGALAGMRLLVYQHSAVGRDLLPRILRELGAEAVTAGRSETFVALDTENVSDADLSRLDQLLATSGVEGASAIVSTDGDSDRPLVVAVRQNASPGRLRFLPGDLLGVVVAELLSADAVAVPISANDAVERRMKELGVTLEKTRIGSPYVVAALEELRTKGSRRVVGWEANGGFLTGTELGLPGAKGVLSQLPTRDATLPIVANLFAARSKGLTLDALWSRLPARFGRSGLLDEVPTEASRGMMQRLIPAGVPVETDLTRGEPASWEPPLRALGRVFTSGAGFGAPVRLDVRDGLRIWFASGDVVHVRPSGNAPQLRIYANCDSQARADAIVEEGLKEPDGLLRQLLREG